MPDETLKLQDQLKKEAGEVYQFISKPVYNIDDMDDRAFMRDHRMEGVYVLGCKAMVDVDRPGRVYVNGADAGEPIVSPSAWGGGCSLGLRVRRFIRDYGQSYTVRYEGAFSVEGNALPSFSFQLNSLPKSKIGEVYPEHDELVLQAAQEGMVLLKNENEALPLGKGAVVNAFGKASATFRLGCVGAGKINPRYGIRFEEGIRAYSSLELNGELFEFYRSRETNEIPTQDLLNEAREKSDTAVILLTRGTGESSDNRPIQGDYYLTDEEKRLLETVSDAFAKTVVILNVGYPIEMGWVEEYKVDAVLWCGLPGMAGGRALAEILEGTVSPSGRLPDTWSLDYYDIPAAKNFYVAPEGTEMSPFGNTFVTTVYEEDMYVGYRYFETFGKPVAFPFGHGLSYTTFEKSVVSAAETNCAVLLDISVKNTGDCSSKEVILIYAAIPDGKLEQPAKRLVAFAKTRELAPGETQAVHMDIPCRRFESYDEETASWVIEPGKISLLLGGSVAEAGEVFSFDVPELVVLSRVENRVTPPIAITRLSKKDPEGTYPTGQYCKAEASDDLPYRRSRSKTPEKRQVAGEKPTELITFPMLVEDESLLNAFVLQLSDYELARLSVGGRVGWGIDDNGFAGTLYNEGKIAHLQIPDYFMADGNNGLNMHDATIGFPVSNTMAATFNEELSFAEGKAIATEGKDLDLQCILAPAMNLHRNPLCGRHSEYFSEDPYLAGRMGGQESAGFEAAGASSVMKHFIANNAENYRNRNHSIMSERCMRELYLKVFEVAMEVNIPDAMMTGYNPANGEWCAGDEELLEGILREEWGFTGYVMTDWGSSTCCPPASTAQGGNSWVAPGGMDDREPNMIVAALEDGTIDRERVRANVRDMYGTVAKRLRLRKAVRK